VVIRDLFKKRTSKVCCRSVNL